MNDFVESILDVVVTVMIVLIAVAMIREEIYAIRYKRKKKALKDGEQE